MRSSTRRAVSGVGRPSFGTLKAAHPRALMSIPGKQRRPSSNSLWWTLRNDPVAGLTLGIYTAATVLYLVPALEPWQLSFVSLRLGPFVFLSLTVTALWVGLGRIKAREDRAFWSDLLLAFVFWWTAAAIILFFPEPEDKPFVADFTTSVLYALYYVVLLMAVERQPHRRHRWRPLALERSLTWPTATAVVVGLFLYFPVMAVVASESDAYESGIPDFCLFIALDGYLAFRWLWLFRATASPRWRLTYALITASTLTILANDLAEAFALEEAGGLWHWDALGNVLLYLPYVLLVAAARLRHHPFPWEPPPPASRIRLEENFPGPLGQTLSFIVLFPLIHFSTYELGILESESLFRREVLVLVWLPILGGIGLVQYRILERALKELKEERHSSERALHKTQKELRLAQERQLTDEALRTSYERFSKAFRSCPDVMAISRLEDGLLVDVNESCKRVFGYSPDEFIGRTSEELGLWSDPEARAGAVAELERSGQVSLETGFRKRSGEERIGLFSARRIELDGKPHLFSVTSDVTSTKRREEALRGKTAALEAAVSAIWALDGDGRVVFANEAARRFGGRPPGETASEDESLRIHAGGDGELSIVVVGTRYTENRLS